MGVNRDYRHESSELEPSGRESRDPWRPNTTRYWKLTASNPGQFSENVFCIGPGSATLSVTIPGPFVAEAAVPLHIYSGVSLDASISGDRSAAQVEATRSR
jgi:hypothetical protein